MADMVSEHKDDIALFQKESQSGKDADIKGFAVKTLPTLRDHLKMTQTTHAATSGSKATMAASTMPK